MSQKEEVSFPPGKDRLLASYHSHERLAYVEAIGIGDIMPEMPLFLGSDLKIKIPLESTYQATWETMPFHVRTASKNARSENLSRSPKGSVPDFLPIDQRD